MDQKKTKFIPQPTFLQLKIRETDSLKWPRSADEDMDTGIPWPSWWSASEEKCHLRDKSMSEAWGRDTPVSAPFPVGGKEEKKKHRDGLFLPKPQQPTNQHKIGVKEKHQETIMLNSLPREEMRKEENLFLSKPPVIF